MKISNILIALTFVFAMACSGKKSNEKQGHSHDTESNTHPHDKAGESHGHSHDANGGHAHEEGEQKEQEEFVVDASATRLQTDTTLTLAANGAMEFKFRIKKGKSISYRWTSSTPLIYDFHGDPAPELGYKKGYFESFAKGKSSGEKGEQAVPYDGSHGWYWKNESGKEVTITLSTAGEYKDLGLK